MRRAVLAMVPLFVLQAGCTPVVTATGEGAAVMRDAQPVQPVALGERDGKTLAVVLARDEDEAEQLNSSLFKERPVCKEDGPETCCAESTRTAWLRTWRGWLDSGQACATPFVPPDPDLSALLPAQSAATQTRRISVPDKIPSKVVLTKDQTIIFEQQTGVDYALLTMGGAGETVIIVELWHPNPAPPVCVDDFDSCRTHTDGRECYKWSPLAHQKWYAYDQSKDKWCRVGPTCGC